MRASFPRLAALGLACLCLGCAIPRQPRVLNPKFAHKNMQGRTLRFLPLASVSMDRFVGQEFARAFHGDTAVLNHPAAYFSSLIFAGLQQTADRIDVSYDSTNGPDTSRLIRTVLSFPDPKLAGPTEFFHPDSGFVARPGEPADLALVISAVDMKLRQLPSVAVGAMNGTSGTNAIVMTFNYLIWDYKNNVPLLYGKEVGTPEPIGMESSLRSRHWSDIALDVAWRATRSSPLASNVPSGRRFFGSGAVSDSAK